MIVIIRNCHFKEFSTKCAESNSFTAVNLVVNILATKQARSPPHKIRNGK